jgi:hypothetical protein
MSPELKARTVKRAKLDDRSVSKWIEIAIVERLNRLDAKTDRETVGRGR